ncbi:hypothetical protein C8J56DRAFT_892027 [Mycena floridula]|nr:hypothetical protein C8J56DRAFT_892027 [Mycena floridula]
MWEVQMSRLCSAVWLRNTSRIDHKTTKRKPGKTGPLYLILWKRCIPEDLKNLVHKLHDATDKAPIKYYHFGHMDCTVHLKLVNKVKCRTLVTRNKQFQMFGMTPAEAAEYFSGRYSHWYNVPDDSATGAETLVQAASWDPVRHTAGAETTITSGSRGFDQKSLKKKHDGNEDVNDNDDNENILDKSPPPRRKLGREDKGMYKEKSTKKGSARSSPKP